MDSYGLFNYPVIVGDSVLCDQMDEFFNMIPYNGNKILRADVAAEVEWYNALMELNTAIKSFV